MCMPPDNAVIDFNVNLIAIFSNLDIMFMEKEANHEKIPFHQEFLKKFTSRNHQNMNFVTLNDINQYM